MFSKIYLTPAPKCKNSENYLVAYIKGQVYFKLGFALNSREFLVILQILIQGERIVTQFLNGYISITTRDNLMNLKAN